MTHDPMHLEQYLIPPEDWDRVVPGVIRIEGITDEIERYPVAYGCHPKDGWFVLSTGQGPFIVWAQWDQPQGVTELNFATPTPEPEPFREALIWTLDRFREKLRSE